MGSPSTSICFSNICHPLGRTINVQGLSFNWYFLPAGFVNEIVPLIASRKLIWPFNTLFQVGAVESIKYFFFKLNRDDVAFYSIYYPQNQPYKLKHQNLMH